MDMMITTATFVFRRIWRFQTIAVGIGMMMRSIKILRPQLERMNLRLSMHFPPLITVPLGPTWSIAALIYAYRTGVHWKILTKVVDTRYPMFIQTKIISKGNL